MRDGLDEHSRGIRERLEALAALRRERERGRQAAAASDAAAGEPPGVPPEVLYLFERLALSVRRAGFERYSARAILHRIRWHFRIERGIRDWKCNNNWTPAMARWCMARHPVELDRFFELRQSPHTSSDDEEREE